MSEDETPFSRTPPPGIVERPSPYTLAGKIAFFGAMAQGLRGRSPILRILVALFVIGLFFLPAIGLIVSLWPT